MSRKKSQRGYQLIVLSMRHCYCYLYWCCLWLELKVVPEYLSRENILLPMASDWDIVRLYLNHFARAVPPTYFLYHVCTDFLHMIWRELSSCISVTWKNISLLLLLCQQMQMPRKDRIYLEICYCSFVVWFESCLSNMNLVFTVLKKVSSLWSKNTG